MNFSQKLDHIMFTYLDIHGTLLIAAEIEQFGHHVTHKDAIGICPVHFIKKCMWHLWRTHQRLHFPHNQSQRRAELVGYIDKKTQLVLIQLFHVIAALALERYGLMHGNASTVNAYTPPSKPQCSKDIGHNKSPVQIERREHADLKNMLRCIGVRRSAHMQPIVARIKIGKTYLTVGRHGQPIVRIAFKTILRNEITVVSEVRNGVLQRKKVMSTVESERFCGRQSRGQYP